MFNEAFWFFWVVDIVGRFTFLFGTLAVFSLLGLMVCLIAVDEVHPGNKDDPSRDWILWKRWVFSLLSIGFISLVLSMAIPPASAFYAGAGQYVAESAELDDTLLLLKDAIDTKLEELANE